MHTAKHTTDLILPGSDGSIAIPDEISCVFRLGKDKNHDLSMIQELIDLETEKNIKNQASHVKLSATAESEAILKIKNQLKLSSSLQVHSSDGSLISVFNTQPNQSIATNSTNVEQSLELPLSDLSFLQPYLDDPSIKTPTSDFNFDDLFDIDLDPTMTIQDLTDVPLELETQDQATEMTVTETQIYDEASVSSISSPSSNQSANENDSQLATQNTQLSGNKLARFGNKQVIKYSNEYHTRRVKNNEAVKKSRMKAKEKQKASESQMSKLAEENRALNDRVDLLMKELQVLRSLYKELKHDPKTKSG